MRDLDQRLQDAMDHAAPDVLGRILSSCETQKGTVMPMSPTSNQKKTRWTSLSIAAALAVMLCGGIGLHGWQTAHAVASTISLDVNPSIQLQVNKNEKVLSAQAMNQDALEILDGMDLQGTQLNVAMNAIVGSLLQHGYLESLSSAILISVEDNNTKRAESLEDALTTEVDAALQRAAAGAAVLSQTLTHDADLTAQAQTSNISVGKAALVKQVQSLNSSLDFDALAALSIEELKQLAEIGAPDMPIGIAAAAAAAEKYAGTYAVDSVVWEADPELDEWPSHYEVEVKTHLGSYDYIVDAWSGEILKGPANIMDIPRPAQTPSSIITQEEAQSIALANAGVNAKDALGLRVQLDYDDGIQTYEVDFRAGNIAYEYSIRASNGNILKVDWDNVWDDVPTPVPVPAPTPAPAPEPSNPSYIGKEAAEKAALDHANLSAAAVSGLYCALDIDDGVPCYEIEFRAGQMEYDYEIHAVSGAILKADAEYDD